MSSRSAPADGVYAIPVPAVLPDAAAVLGAQGVGGHPRPKVADAVGRALALLEESAAPAAAVSEVSAPEFQAIFRGEGRNERPNPLEAVLPGARRLALFAVTIGRPVCAEIDRLFRVNEFALGCLLDTAASLAADKAAAWVEGECHRAWVEAHRAGPRPEFRSLRYSPGYCGWHLSGQKSLFAALRPGRIGLSLGETFLMSPLKSVSGVVVAAGKSMHSVEPGYAFCSACRPKSCRDRKEAGP